MHLNQHDISIQSSLPIVHAHVYMYTCPSVHSSQYYNLIFQMADDESEKLMAMPSTEGVIKYYK